MQNTDQLACGALTVQVFKPVPATDEAMSAFHAPDYISFLKHISPDNQVTLVLVRSR